MNRLQLACIAMNVFIAVIYFSVRRTRTKGHVLYSIILFLSVFHLSFDTITVYTVNHMDEVPAMVNEVCHRIFIGSMVILLYLMFRYIIELINRSRENDKNPRIFWGIPLLISLIGVIFLPLSYKETAEGNYSYGAAANVAYISVAFYLIVSLVVLFVHWQKVNKKKRFVIVIAMSCEFVAACYQAIFPTELISGLGLTLIVLSFFLTVESPDVHLIETLKEERKRADLANSAKSNFLARMSHEIRTPINAIMGMNEMILRESSEDEIRQYSVYVKSSTQTLYSLINDILDMTRIESGKMEIIPVEYEFCSMIFDLTNTISEKAKRKKLDFVTYIDPTIPSVLFGDDVRIYQVLSNLLTNAVKYTNEGKVTLRATAKRDGDNAVIHFAVEDTGIGIKEEDISKLFTAFERIEEKRNRHIEGTGLGMNIVMQLLELMNSSIKVESVYGKGSTFSFDLVQPIISDAEIGDFEARMRDFANKYKYKAVFEAPDANLLVVDDNDVNRKVFVSLLKQTKVRIDEAEDGPTCLNMVKDKHYDIIFLDHMMPGMDGIETLEHLREMDCVTLKDTLFVALTANAMSGAKEEYLSLGFDAFLSKPIIPDKLEKMIRSMLPNELVQMKDEAELIEEIPADDDKSEELPYIEGFDWNSAMLHFSGQEQLQYAIADFYDIMEREAVMLDALCANADHEEGIKEYRVRVHGFKSSAALVGAMQLFGLARTLEMAAAGNNTNRIRMLNPVLTEEIRRHKANIEEVIEFAEE